MNVIIEYIREFYEANLGIIRVAVSLALFLVFLIFRNKIANGILNLISKCFIKDEKKSEPFKKSFLRPLAMFFLLLGCFILAYVNFRITPILKVFKIATILIICWGLLNYFSGNLFLILHIDENTTDKINVTAVKFISNILKILVAAFAVVMVVSELGYNINGLITGIGVGGLAVSLAAQDAVSNLISGFIIVIEKPFGVGDFIETNSLQGTVEEVGMRSTVIRTLDDALVTMPNSTLTNDAIINISRMNKRLFNLEYGVTYSTSNELLKKCLDDIKAYLLTNDKIINEPIRVELDKLDDSSLNINIFCYTVIIDIHQYNHLLTEINLNVKSIIEKNGIEFAFPSRSIYIEKSE